MATKGKVESKPETGANLGFEAFTRREVRPYTLDA